MSTLSKVALSVIGHLKPERAKARAVGPVTTLPPPQTQGGMPLMRALAARATWRDFRTEELPPQALSDLLWSAFGVNRPGTRGRTAPTALDAQEIDIYLAMAGGLYVYDAFAHSLSLVAAVDARKVTGFQDFVDDAPLDLVYVADHSHLAPVPADQRLAYSAVAAGAMVQNVYLYCASAGLATVVRGWFDRSALAHALGLTEHEHVIITQTVGYPR